MSDLQTIAAALERRWDARGLDVEHRAVWLDLAEAVLEADILRDRSGIKRPNAGGGRRELPSALTNNRPWLAEQLAARALISKTSVIHYNPDDAAIDELAAEALRNAEKSA